MKALILLLLLSHFILAESRLRRKASIVADESITGTPVRFRLSSSAWSHTPQSKPSWNDEARLVGVHSTDTDDSTKTDDELSGFDPDSGRDLLLVGSDDRSILNTTLAYPYRTVGRVMNQDSSWCSGTMVGPSVMLTAQHCIKYDALGKMIPLKFAPAYNEGNEPYGNATSSSAFYYQRKTTNTYQAAAYDFAVVLLDQPIGHRVGWLGTTVYKDSLIDSQHVDTIGYPDDYFGQPIIEEAGLIKDALPFDEESVHMIESDLDTMPGQSGGPMYFRGVDGGYRVVAVCAANDGGDEDPWNYWAGGKKLVELVRFGRDVTENKSRSFEHLCN